MDQWEYLEVARHTDIGSVVREIVFSINGKSQVDPATGTWDNAPEWYGYIASLGDNGWELVAIEGACWAFKRRKQG
jgi:hypothetical protein